jgi:hypothetical protein
MTTPDENASAEQRWFEARQAARREAFRLARDTGAPVVITPVFRGSKEPTLRDVEPLAGARAARDLELASRRTARDYIRQAREGGHGWDQIGQALGLGPGHGAGQQEATAGDAAYTYAAGRPDTEPPWQPRSFVWTCRSCDQHISDRGLTAGPADDEPGHAGDCARHAAAIAEWNAQDAQWTAEWEAGQ